MDTYLMMFSKNELIVAGIALVVIVLVFLLIKLLSSKSSKKAIMLAEEEADFYCDLYYAQVMKEAKLKYKAYVAKGYSEKNLPGRKSPPNYRVFPILFYGYSFSGDRFYIYLCSEKR